MPTWSGIGQELQTVLAQQQQGQQPASLNAFDIVRRRYMVKHVEKEKRDLILYATSFTKGAAGIPPELLQITDADMQGIMEVVSTLDGPALDLVLHSPGGSIEAAESIVRYLRTKFDDIRVIVPHLAMSAATMIACSANKIVMGGHSSLGPIDPQLTVQTPLGFRPVAVDAILAQFERAQAECEDPRKLRSWAPMLTQYGPDLLELCQNARALSAALVTEWLREYMFAGDESAEEKAATVAVYLGNHGERRTHGRHLCRGELQDLDLNIVALEDDQEMQDNILSIFHAMTYTFDGTSAVKIIENHKGNAFVQMVQQQPLPVPAPHQVFPPAPGR
jgi:hypothetical protein